MAREARGVLLALVLLAPRTTAAAVAHYPLGLSAAANLLEVTLPTARSAVRAAYRRKARACRAQEPIMAPRANLADGCGENILRRHPT